MAESRTSSFVLGTTDRESTASSSTPLPSAAAFEDACERAWPSLVRFLRATAGSDLDIEDLASQVMEIAWRRRTNLQELDAIVPWLLAIGHNVTKNGRRSAHRRLRLHRRLEASAVRRYHPSAHVELVRDEPGPATRALATLASADREILVLHAWEELDNAAVARVLDISVAAAAQRLHRARKRLEAALANQDDAP